MRDMKIEGLHIGMKVGNSFDHADPVLRVPDFHADVQPFNLHVAHLITKTHRREIRNWNISEPETEDFEARSPKAEGRKKAELRNPKTETQGRARFGLLSAFGFPPTFDLRLSFSLRI